MEYFIWYVKKKITQYIDIFAVDGTGCSLLKASAARLEGQLRRNDDVIPPPRCCGFLYTPNLCTRAWVTSQSSPLLTKVSLML